MNLAGAIIVGIIGLIAAAAFYEVMCSKEEIDFLREKIDKYEDRNTTVQSELVLALSDLKKEVERMKEQLNEIPTEQLEDEYRKMASWNEGVANILAFGPNVPKINKEGVKRG